MPKTILYTLIALLALGLSGTYAEEEEEQDPVTTLSKELFKVLTPQSQQQQQQTPEPQEPPQEEQQQTPPLQAPGGLPEATQPKLPGMKVPEMKKAEPAEPWAPEVNCPGSTDCDGDGHHASHHGGDDCHDGDAARFPGNVEVADSDNHDEDCDPFTYGSLDEDGDGHHSNAACNYLQDGRLHCGTDCDDANYAIVPGAQMCLDEREIRTCRKSAFRPYASGDQVGWDNGYWQTSVCENGCAAQPNGTGICR